MSDNINKPKTTIRTTDPTFLSKLIKDIEDNSKMYHLEEAKITLTLVEENGNDNFVPRQSSIVGSNLRHGNISTEKHAPTDDEDSRLLKLEELQDLQYEPSTKKQTNDLKGVMD